jgi:hypothetical protein
MSTHACRSPELQHLDFVVFSILFSRSVAYTYLDICACFFFFYVTFYLLHATRDEDMCSHETQSTYTPNVSINDGSWW